MRKIAATLLFFAMGAFVVNLADRIIGIGFGEVSFGAEVTHKLVYVAWGGLLLIWFNFLESPNENRLYQGVLSFLRSGDWIDTPKILHRLEEEDRKVSFGKLYTLLRRLEDMGVKESRLSDDLPPERLNARGGRPVRQHRIIPSASR